MYSYKRHTLTCEEHKNIINNSEITNKNNADKLLNEDTNNQYDFSKIDLWDGDLNKQEKR